MRARLLPLLAAAVAAPAWAADLNVISSVEVKDTGPEVVLTVTGSRKPSFTTFSMADPPRFVIDFSESKFQGVPEEQRGAGVIQLVKALSYGSDASAIARIMIAFTAEVDPPTVEDSGNSLVLRVAKPAGGGVAVAAADDKTKASADAGAKAKADADAKAKADADAKAKADAEVRAKLEEEKRQAQAKADEKAKADAEAKAKADEDQRQARAKADQDAKAKADADAKARADANAKAKADADAKARADADAKAKAEATAGAASEEDAEQKALDAEIAAARAEASGGVAKAATRPSAPAKQSVEKLSPSEPETRVREVGFKQLAEASRVFIRTSSPAQFSIEDVDDRTVRIQLQNTRATRYNDLRFLDTSFFPSAVQLITPSREGSSYVLTVKLRERVPYQQVREGDVLAVDFQRPPSTASATPPPARDAPDSGASDEPSEE